MVHLFEPGKEAYTALLDAATDVQAAYKAAVQKQRPPIPEDGRCDAATRELITSCWAQEASARPSAVELLETLAGHG